MVKLHTMGWIARKRRKRAERRAEAVRQQAALVERLRQEEAEERERIERLEAADAERRERVRREEASWPQMTPEEMDALANDNPGLRRVKSLRQVVSEMSDEEREQLERPVEASSERWERLPGMGEGDRAEGIRAFYKGDMQKAERLLTPEDIKQLRWQRAFTEGGMKQWDKYR